MWDKLNEEKKQKTTLSSHYVCTFLLLSKDGCKPCQDPSSSLLSSVSSESWSNGAENPGRNERSPPMDALTPPLRFVAETILAELINWQACLFGRFNGDEEILTKALEAFSSIPLGVKGVRGGCLVMMMGCWAASSGDKLKSVFWYFLDSVLKRAFGHLREHELCFRANTFSSELIYRLVSPIRGEHLLRWHGSTISEPGKETGFHLRTTNFRILHFSSLICPPPSSCSSTSF